jgi:hypothetical protein
MCSIMTIRPDTLCGKKKHMEKRHCLECGGELVLAFRPALRRGTNRERGLRRSRTEPGDAVPAGMNSLQNKLRGGKLLDPAGAGQT